MTTTINLDLLASNAAAGATANSVLVVAAVNPDGSNIGSTPAGAGGAASLVGEFVTADLPVDITSPVPVTRLKALVVTGYDPQAAAPGTGVLHLIISDVVYSIPYVAAGTATGYVFEIARLEGLDMPVTDNGIQAQLGSALTGGSIVVTASFA